MNPDPTHNNPSIDTQPANEPEPRGLAIGIAAIGAPDGPPLCWSARLGAENFNPYHDEQGHFTTGDAAVAPHGSEHHLPDGGVREFWLRRDGPDQRRGMVDTTGQGQAKVPEPKKYDGKLSAGHIESLSAKVTACLR